MIFGAHAENTLEQFRDVASRADRAALMADGHYGYIMPVGGVAAYRDKVSVSGVGFDIACGNCAIKTDRITMDFWRTGRLEEVADAIAHEISFGIGRNNISDQAPVDHPLFEDYRWELIPQQYREQLREKARDQLGTVGAGNHYVDVFRDEEGYIWVGVHFGSRGFGHTIASNFLAFAAGEKWGTRVSEFEALIHVENPIGHDYLHLMHLAGEYAYAGREWVARHVVSILGGKEIDFVHNHHNFAWRENHDGVNYWVVRKGATPARPGQRGFVGGSMGDKSVILRGTEEAEGEVAHFQRMSLHSTVHGAGRVMSRTQAKGKWNRRTGEIKKPGEVSREMMDEATQGVILRGGDLDEAPQVYRRLEDVLEAQRGTVEIEHVLTPLIVVMAGPDVRDPYKD